MLLSRAACCSSRGGAVPCSKATSCSPADRIAGPMRRLYAFVEQDLLETAIHEALHALFFSELLFPYYLDENGQKRKDVVRLDSEGHKVVITPTVKQAVRDHFACDTMDGAPLENEGRRPIISERMRGAVERCRLWARAASHAAVSCTLCVCDQGGGGTAGNHWESRFFKGELMDGMSGAPNERAVFSAITMALLEDTGWYSANWGLQVTRGLSVQSRSCACSPMPRTIDSTDRPMMFKTRKRRCVMLRASCCRETWASASTRGASLQLSHALKASR